MATHTDCDLGIARATPEAVRSSDDHPRLIILTTILASSLALIDGSVVKVGLPTIAKSLSATGDGLSWVVNGYPLSLSALLLVGGALGDTFGRRRIFTLGIAIFGVASIICAVAPNLPSLIACRLLEGSGAALLMPNSLAILGASFTGERRGKAVGVWAAASAAAGAEGPVIGGWLIDTVGWRSIFLINLPLAVSAITLAVRYVHDDRAETPRSLDFVGAGLAAAAALASLTWGLTTVSADKGLGPASGAVLAGGAAALGAFLIVERRNGEGAMLPLALFESRTFAGLTLLTLLL